MSDWESCLHSWQEFGEQPNSFAQCMKCGATATAKSVVSTTDDRIWTVRQINPPLIFKVKA